MRLAEGHESAFIEVYNRYAASVKRFILQYIKSPDLADDLSQEIFIKLWENRFQLGKIQSLKPYLFIMVRNHTLNTLKRASREEVLLSELVRHYPVARNDFGDELLLKDYTKRLRIILESMPARTREVFYLCRECQKPYDEVAGLLGISRNAVKKHMMRSMKTFRESFKKDLGITFTILLIIFS